jgi:hypothetical protein
MLLSTNHTDRLRTFVWSDFVSGNIDNRTDTHSQEAIHFHLYGDSVFESFRLLHIWQGRPLVTRSLKFFQRRFEVDVIRIDRFIDLSECETMRHLVLHRSSPEPLTGSWKIVFFETIPTRWIPSVRTNMSEGSPSPVTVRELMLKHKTSGDRVTTVGNWERYFGVPVPFR